MSGRLLSELPPEQLQRAAEMVAAQEGCTAEEALRIGRIAHQFVFKLTQVMNEERTR